MSPDHAHAARRALGPEQRAVIFSALPILTMGHVRRTGIAHHAFQLMYLSLVSIEVARAQSLSA